MPDAIARLEQNLEEVRNGLKASNERFESLGKQIAELDRQRNAVATENVRWQGALSGLTKTLSDLKSDESAPTPLVE